MKKLSFILPVYNVEPYLEKCIRSIKDKHMPSEEFEIIVVNDGSPDNSEDLVRELQKTIPNILLINQENAGVSAARNRGIEKASGEYIVFIDPDDYVNINLLKRLYDRAQKDDLDILLCGRSIVKPNGEIVHKLGYNSQKDYIYNGVNAYYEKDISNITDDNCWGRLYRRNLVNQNNIDFPEGVIHLEDGVFVRKIFTIAKRVGFENCDFYQAYERPGSASRSKIGTSLKAAKGDVKSAKDLLNFKKSNNLDPEQIGIMNRGIVKYTILPLLRALHSKDLRALIKYDRLLTKEGLKPLEIEHVRKGLYLDYAKAFNNSLWMFAISYILNNLKKKFTSKIV